MHTYQTAVTATVLFLLAAQAKAGHFCHHCGCQRDCKKVCRLEVKTKEKKDIEYSCECEDFCVPGPSKWCTQIVDSDCDRHPQRKFVWTPTCAKVYTRKKLVAKEVKKEVPDYKWVVEKYCCVCGHMIKVEEGDKAGGGKSGGNKTSDARENDERPLALMPAEEAAQEMRAGRNRSYDEGDTLQDRAPAHLQDRAAAQGWPTVIRRGGTPPVLRFTGTNVGN
jgi:hypothetical protein